MPARTTQFGPGCYYHLYNRGVNRQSIFLDERDYVNFLLRVRKYCEKYTVQPIAYCLMPNHFHFLMRQESEQRAGLVIQHACNGYAQFFNRRHQRQGALFKGASGPGW